MLKRERPENEDDTDRNGTSGPTCQESRKWQITIPKEPGQSGVLWKPAEDLLNRFMNLKTEYKCWADHIGRKTGYKHYHCYVRFKSSKKEQTMRNKFGRNIRMMYGDDHENAAYISEKGENKSFQETGHKKTNEEKDGIGKMREYIESGMSIGEAVDLDETMHLVADRHRYSLNLFEAEVEKRKIRADHKRVGDYYPYQQFIIDMIQEPAHPRHIHWFLDTLGGAGKSDFAKEITVLYNAFKGEVIAPDKKMEDNAYFMAANTWKRQTTIVIDFARWEAAKINWSIVENLKNGHFTVMKYAGKQFIKPRPHMIVFANEKPLNCTLSTDRIMLHTIENNIIVKSELFL